MLLDVPLPIQAEIDSDDETGDENLLMCFPLVGIALGVCAYFVAYITGLLFPVTVAAAVVGAVILTLGTEIAASSSSISVLTGFIKTLINRHGDTEQETKLDSPHTLMIFLSLYLLKLFCTGLLIYHGKISWIIVVYALSYLIRSQLVQMPSMEDGTALIEEEDDKYAVKMPWIAAGAGILLGGLGSSLPAAVLMLALAFALIAGFKRLSASSGGVSPHLIGVYGVISELIFLCAGAAIVIR